MLSIIRIILTLAFLAILLLPASAIAQQKPVLYPNAKLKQVGQTQANADIGICEGEARSNLAKTTQKRQGLKKGLRGAAKGAALGVLGGAVVGDAGKGAGAGAAIGGTVGVVKGARQSGSATPEYKQWVESCLTSKGYQVMRWQ